MQCTSCKFANPPGMKFCVQCGHTLGTQCRKCGAEFPADFKFCGSCGAALTASPTDMDESNAHRQPPAPNVYTPKHLADKILQSRSALEGERKQVTVMFADVKGSMELAEQLDPEQWHKMLDRFFEILSEGVHQYEGTVNQYTGDGVMALFGAPLAHEDHAQRACYAALHIRNCVAEYATEVKRKHGVGFLTRMGLNSGEVVVGAIGDDLRMDYTAQGHTVGLAQRMESLAEPNTCFMGAATASLVGGFFELTDLGEFDVKGVNGPVGVYRLDGAGSSQTRFDVARSRGLARFVGRAADMRTLEDALQQSHAGNGQVVGVVAEAGTGKSRLCFEFLEQCRARGVKVYEGRAVAHGRNIPFIPVLEVFRSFFGITIKDNDTAAREKIAGRMMVLDQQFADSLPLLFDFLGVDDPQRPAPKLDPEARMRQLIAIMRQLIHTVNEDQPTVTMIEDLHWLDDASAEFIEHMVDAREGTRNMLLLNFRPEYRAEWMQKSWYRQLPLTPLGRDAVAELLADLLGSDGSLEALAAPVYERTGGNPFFVEEVAQLLIESGHLERTEGIYRLVTPVDELGVPTTVQAILAARIDRLPEREKRLLQTASVIGKDVPERLLAAVAELPKDELRSAIAALRKAEFLYELAIFPEVEYSFKHPLTQEVALGSQLNERRRVVHAAVAREVEADGGNLEERAALLAHHYEEAGETLTAAQWHRRAAEWVVHTDVHAARRHWQRVRRLLRELPDDANAARLGITAATQLLNTAWRFGIDVHEARETWEEGCTLAEGIDDPSAAVHISMVYGRALCGEGDVAAYVEIVRNGLATVQQIDDVHLNAGVRSLYVDAFVFAGEFPEALRMTEHLLEHYPRYIPPNEWVGSFNPYSLMTFFRAECMTWMGRLPEAVDEFARARTLADEDGSPELIGYNHFFSGAMFYHANDADGALACAGKLEELCRQLGDPPSLAAYLHVTHAYAHLAAERGEEAAAAARTALECLERVEKFQQGHAAALLAEGLLLAGDPEGAQRAARDAIERCRRSVRPQWEAIAHGVEACALMRTDGSRAQEAVERALTDAGALIKRTGAATLAPRLIEWRAEWAGVSGDNDERVRLLEEALKLYGSIGATGHAKRLSKRANA